MNISSENLVYWYFRLNGFLGNNNFIIHRTLENGEHVTDLDFVGVRFQHRKELYDDSTEFMRDDYSSSLFNPKYKDKDFICIVEAKASRPSINSSWLETENLNQVFLSVGLLNPKRLPKIVEQLRKKGSCTYNRYYISFIAIASFKPRINAGSRSNIINKIPVITWEEVLTFIYGRFKKYNRVKSQMNEWGNSEGQQLKIIVDDSQDFNEFCKRIINSQTNRNFFTPENNDSDC
jgi:hypothetical protein